MKGLSIAVLLHCCVITLASPVSRHEVIHNHGAVASESKVCSRIGIDLQKKGGNAADALVGTVLCVGVIGMYHSGIGGGGFMLVRSANGSYEFIDFRETAPAAAFQDMYVNNTAASIYGGLASGVPGELKGLDYLHRHYGKLPWKTVVTPAVNVARKGFVVTNDTVNYMNSATAPPATDFLTNNPTWAIDFAPNGTRVKLGDILTRKRYADTLEQIGEYGISAFYSGAIAETTIQALRKANGTMTLKDLAGYKVALRKPASINYRGYKMHSCSAPSSGAIALSIMKTIEGYNMSCPNEINITTHRLDEAIRFGYGARADLGDPSFVKGVTKYQRQLLDEPHAEEVRSKISDFHTQNVSAYDPKGLESLETPGTSHIVTADKEGMAVSLTTTINLLFGSQVIVPETGIIMNNEMNDFSIPGSSNAFGYVPSPANYIRPGKRPLSSISPTIVERADGSLYFIVGAAGGSRIITATVQNLWHVLDQGLSSAQAIGKPRLHDQLSPNIVSFEWTYDNSTVAFMKSLGHNVTWVASQSSAHVIRRLENGTFDAAGDPRQKSSAGYSF